MERGHVRDGGTPEARRRSSESGPPGDDGAWCGRQEYYASHHLGSLMGWIGWTFELGALRATVEAHLKFDGD